MTQATAATSNRFRPRDALPSPSVDRSLDPRAGSASVDRAAWLVRAVGAVVLVALGVLATIDAWADMVRIARFDEESSHIRLVPVAAAWLLWIYRDRVGSAGDGLRWVGPAIAALGAILYALGDRLVIEAMWHLGAVLLAVGAIGAAFGGRRLLAAWPAAVVLLFLIPVPGGLRAAVTQPLQTTSATLAGHALELLGEPVLLRGSVLTIGGIDVAVAEACNGMRMFFALALVSYLYAFLHPLKTWVRVVLLAISPAVALGCNVIRLVPTTYAYGHASMETADLFHDVGGWAMLFVAYFVVAGLVALVRWVGVEVDQSSEQQAAADGDDRVRSPQQRGPWLLGAAAVAVLAGAAFADRTIIRPPPAEATAFHAHVRDAVANVPSTVVAGADGVLVAEDVPLPPAAVAMLEPNATLSKRFRRVGGGPDLAGWAQFLIIHCRDARDLQGHYPPNCYPGRGFEPQSSEPVEWPELGLVGQRYVFTRDTNGVNETVHVFNLMLLPDGTVGRDMTTISDASRRLRLRERGAAQVQIVFPAPRSASMPTDESRQRTAEMESRFAAQLLAAHKDAIDAMLGKSEPIEPDAE